jgi:hypothetical protein
LRESWLALCVNIPQILLLLLSKDFIQFILYKLIHRTAQNALNPGDIYATKYSWALGDIAANIPAIQPTQQMMAISSITGNWTTHINLNKGHFSYQISFPPK